MNWKTTLRMATVVVAFAGLAAASTVTITFTNSYSGLGGPTPEVFHCPYILSFNSGG